MTGSLDGRIALVTGASRGIGKAAALAYAGAGAHVIAVARAKSIGALEELDDEIRALTGEAATIVPLDLADGPGIDKLGGAIYERWGKLDILLANAGLLGPLSPISHIDPKDWDKVMNINVTACFRLIRSMEPLLKISDAGRAIFISSGAANKHTPYWGLYGASKAAVQHLALTWANECAITNTKVNVVDPGPIRTAMRAEAIPGEDPETLPIPEQIAPLLAHLASPEESRNGEVISFYDWAGLKRG